MVAVGCGGVAVRELIVDMYLAKQKIDKRLKRQLLTSLFDPLTAFGQGRSVVVVALVDVIDGYNNMVVRRSGCLVVDL